MTLGLSELNSAEDDLGLVRMLVNVYVRIDSRALPARSDEVLAAAVANFEQAILTAHRAGPQRHLDAAVQAYGAARDELRNLQEKRQALLQGSGRVDLRRESLIDEIRSLEDDQRRFRMELGGMEARKRVTQELIAELGAQLRAGMAEADDTVLQQLKLVARVREQDLESMRELVEKGFVTSSELISPEAELASARAEIAQVRADLAYRKGGEQIGRMKEDLSETVIEMAQMRAQLDMIQREVATSRAALQSSDEYDRLDALEIPMAEDAYRRARERYDEIRFRLSVKPSVVVVGAKKDAI